MVYDIGAKAKSSSMLYKKEIRSIIGRRGKAIGNHRITYEGERNIIQLVARRC